MSRVFADFDSMAADRSADGLAIALGREISAPSPQHGLLAAFHFGAPNRDGDDRAAVVSTGLAPVDGRDLYECWWYNGPVGQRMIGDIGITECADYALVVLQRKDVTPGQIRELTYESYLDLLSAIGTTEHPHIAKIWNYFADINEGEGDGEKYRQFSIGRAEAFEQAGVIDSSVPCGTAVGGGAGMDLSIIALASRHAFVATENPRQVSAYVYPRQYGPRSPKFSRGGYIDNSAHRLFALSGTAAIVGHESAHPHQTERQIDETLENLDHLSRALAASARSTVPILDQNSVLRVYLRDADDYDRVAAMLDASPALESAKVSFLRADICRRELMVEIDGIKVA